MPRATPAKVAHPADAPAIVWFRQDLRLADNPALAAACATGRPIIALFVLDDVSPGEWRLGGASRWWLHHSLAALDETLRRIGGALTLRRGDPMTIVPALVADARAAEVHWNRCYEPFAIARDTKIKETLNGLGVEATSHNGSLLFEPWELRTGAGEPFKVFSPFWRAALARGLPGPASATPKKLRTLAAAPASDQLGDWGLTPSKPDWAGGLRDAWTPGEAGARTSLDRFLSGPAPRYAEDRNAPGIAGTSRLSPHLHWGEISPRQVCAAAADHAKFLSEIGWREFAYHLLFHSPDLPSANWRPAFDAFPWRDDPGQITSWQRGQTGYPVVDAGMRELWATGWMHNRVRMTVASFLVKHLLMHWRAGEDWFWDTLVDADLAINAASWQWVAGSGADAAPYFRIMNPVLQGEKFDADGAYVRRWVPELARLPDAVIHQPWNASASTLADAGVTLGRTYPRPIVDHPEARTRALDAYKTIQRG